MPLRGGGIQGQKSWKHNFEITGDPKVRQVGKFFGWVLRSQTHMGICGPTPLFNAPTGPTKSKMAIEAQNQNSL